MKVIILFVLLLTVSNIIAYHNFGAIFLGIEPSSINRALGVNTGTVNIWHYNPLMTHANPAVSAFHNGVAWGYTKDGWFDDVPGIEGMYYNASFVSYAYKGISFTLPMLNAYDSSGIYFKYDNQSHEQAQYYGFALNPVEIYRNLSSNQHDLFKKLDFSLGTNFVYIRSNLFPEWLGGKEGVAKKMNIGSVVRFTDTINEDWNYELVYGLSLMNANKKTISYNDSENADIIYRTQNHGIAGSFSLKSEAVVINFPIKQFLYYENFLNIRILASSQDDYSNSSLITGFGTEIGLLDSFFFRTGYYNDSDGSVTGNSLGFGLNFNIKQILQLSYNYASFPGGELLRSCDEITFTFHAFP
jgi:hypothetical protein